MQVEVWSDVVCPWCYIGKRRLEEALRRFPHRGEVDVVWRSFQLDPGAPEGEPRPMLPAVAAKYGLGAGQARAMMARVEQVAAEEGLEYRLADAIGGNTALAHELLHHAAEHGRQDELAERLLRACFTEGRSVVDADSLVALAGEVGLDPGDARAALDGRRHRGAVAADAGTAHRLGATGVPFFVVDRRYAAAGAQPADLLLELLERAWQDRAGRGGPAPVTGRTAAAGADGTCAV